MKIGVDFDSTLVSLDSTLQRLAVEAAAVAPEPVLRAAELRAHLQATDRATLWDELHGRATGVEQAQSTAFPGALEFFRRCRKQGVAVVIVGQRPPQPAAGPACDLWNAAGDWLARQGFFNAFGIGLARASVFFEPTVEDQLFRVAAAGCTHFIDDDAATLDHPAFPRGVRRILFEPHPTPAVASPVTVRARGWSHITELLLAGGTR